MSRPFLLLVLLSLCAPLALAQHLPFDLAVPLEGVEAYDPSVPVPDGVIGHAVGARHTSPAAIVRYFEAVAAASDRVELRQHGRTYEGRPLIHAIVTAPERLARIDAVEAERQALMREAGTLGDERLAEMPVVAYMGYSVHGNEASGSEAALLLLYHLAAGRGPAVDEVLENTVVVLDPMLNPDGRDRFVDWVNQNRGGVATADPQDREHREPWPGGRTNHYWFDLNRDWLPAQHPESQARLALFHSWQPQILTDYHEMGGDATYFFQPGIPSRNNPRTPETTYELTAEIATYHAEALDGIGSLYYTRESFDDFYYGKGSTYPDVNGAVGILFEQASSRALRRETAMGELTYAFTVRNQFVASLSTLEAAAAMRGDLLRHTREFYRTAPRVAADADVEAWVFDAPEAPERAAALAEALLRHRIAVHRLARPVDALPSARPGEAFVVPVEQPQARLVLSAFERRTSFTDSLFYDVSAWTLPIAFGVEAEPVRRGADRLLGERVERVEAAPGRVEGGRARVAYLLPWTGDASAQALAMLLQMGVYPRLVHDPFEVAGQTLPRGTLVVPVEARDARETYDVHALVERVAQASGARFVAAQSGLTANGPDLGSRSADVLDAPSVGLVVGSGVSAYAAGEVWHLLTERIRMPVSLLDAGDLGGLDLDRYDTLILPGGALRGVDLSPLERWTRQGGTLVAIESSVAPVVRTGLVELEAREVDVDSLVAGVPYRDVSAARGAHVIGGAIFEAVPDVTHPLAYGYRAPFGVFRTSTAFYDPSSAPGANVAVYADDPLLSGYASDERLGVAGGAAAAVAQRAGRGRVVLLMDRPAFRAFWHGTHTLLYNAVFFGRSF